MGDGGGGSGVLGGNGVSKQTLETWEGAGMRKEGGQIGLGHPGSGDCHRLRVDWSWVGAEDGPEAVAVRGEPLPTASPGLRHPTPRGQEQPPNWSHAFPSFLFRFILCTGIFTLALPS